MNKYAVAAICFAGASFVAASGYDGWGWLIVAGILSL
jgi:hypothetical protein